MKVTLESVMEKRLETVLRKVLGSEDVFVVANIELLVDSDRPDVEVMPGVVVKKTPASSTSPMELPASLVKKVTLSVFLPRAMTDANVETAKTMTERLVGLKTERGDVVNVERVAAPVVIKTEVRTSFLDRALNPGPVILLLWLVASCWGLIFIARRFFDPLVSALRDVVKTPAATAADDRRGAGTSAAERDTSPTLTALAQPASEVRGPDDRKLPFSFIKERDLPALELLIGEQSDVTAAIIVQYLSPALSARVLSKLTPPRREMVLAYMSKPAMINQVEVRRIEEGILSKIDYIMGGEEKLVQMLDQASIAMQAEILETVRKRDPDLGRRLERRVVLLDDIGLLDEAGLTALSRHATVRGMAIVLKNLPHLQEQVFSKLKTGLGEWLSQETSMVTDLPDVIKEAEMRTVLQALTRLVREGKIMLRKDGPPPAIEPAPVTPEEPQAKAPDAPPASAPVPTDGTK